MVSYLDQDHIVLLSHGTQSSASSVLNFQLLLLCCVTLPLFSPYLHSTKIHSTFNTYYLNHSVWNIPIILRLLSTCLYSWLLVVCSSLASFLINPPSIRFSNTQFNICPSWLFTQFCSLVAKSCPTLCDPMCYSPPGSSVCGISQARILDFSISFSRGSFWPRVRSHISCIGRWIIYCWATWEAYYCPWLDLVSTN